MGSILVRNRFWWYRALYDDYLGREMRLAFSIASFIWLPHYWFLGEIDVHWSHRNYTFEFGPRRIRLGHSMVLEEFEQVLENWKELQEDYDSGKLKQLENQIELYQE